MPGNIQSIERAAAILRLLSGRSKRLGVVDLAGELGLSKGTVHGLLRTLQHVGFVEQDRETGKYQLGAALLHMGSSYLDGNELRTRALNWSDSLAALNHRRRCGSARCTTCRCWSSTTCFAPTTASRRSTSARCCRPTRPHSVRCCWRTIRSRLAELTKEGMQSFTDATICDPDRLQRELGRVVERGWAAEIGELHPGQVSIAAPITDRAGNNVGAMGIFGPPERLLAARQPRGELVAHVRDGARAVSRELGAIPW